MDAQRATRRRGVHCVAAALITGAACTYWPSSCFPTVPSDDAGDLSWARQVVPIVLGRKVKGRTEAKMIADMVAVTDRPTVLEEVLDKRGEDYRPRLGF